MNTHTVLTCLGAFVAGVFVGAGLWIALFLCAAALVVWWIGWPPAPPDRLKPVQFGSRPRDRSH